MNQIGNYSKLKRMEKKDQYKKAMEQNWRLHVAFCCLMIAFLCVLVFFCVMSLNQPPKDPGFTIPDEEITETGWVKCPDTNGNLRWRLILIDEE